MSDRKSPALESAWRLYEAINGRDPEAILDALTEDFEGEVSAGMPLGVGGRHVGRDAMLRDVWARVFTAYDVHLNVERSLAADDGSIVIIGDYEGSERSSGRAFKARFAHLLESRGGRVASLEQITDTRSWTAAPTDGPSVGSSDSVTRDQGA